MNEGGGDDFLKTRTLTVVQKAGQCSTTEEEGSTLR